MQCLIRALSQPLWLKRRQRSEHQWHLRKCLRLAEEDRGLASIVAKRGMRLRCCSCREQGFRNVLLKNQAY